MIIHQRHAFLTACGILVLGGSPQLANAQLNECALIGQLGQSIIPGGCIEKPLKDQIGYGAAPARSTAWPPTPRRSRIARSR